MRFAFIEAEKAVWPILVQCRVLQVSKAGYYTWRGRPESARDREDRRIRVLVGEAHERSRRTYGSPRVHAELRAQGVRVSRKRVIRAMQAQGLRGRVRRAYTKTTDSTHGLPTAPNVLDREFTAAAPNERWVGDVTFLRTPDGWLYLAVILDLYSRMVVGWATSGINDRQLALAALDQGLRRRRPPTGLLHHTDQGSPYASAEYQAALEKAGIVCSMSRRGNCWDNAAMESWFGTLKTELGEVFESPTDASRLLFDYVEVFYNQQRRHSSLGYLSPGDFERGAVA